MQRFIVTDKGGRKYSDLTNTSIMRQQSKSTNTLDQYIPTVERTIQDQQRSASESIFVNPYVPEIDFKTESLSIPRAERKILDSQSSRPERKYIDCNIWRSGTKSLDTYKRSEEKEYQSAAQTPTPDYSPNPMPHSIQHSRTPEHASGEYSQAKSIWGNAERYKGTFSPFQSNNVDAVKKDANPEVDQSDEVYREIITAVQSVRNEPLPFSRYRMLGYGEEVGNKLRSLNPFQNSIPWTELQASSLSIGLPSRVNRVGCAASQESSVFGHSSQSGPFSFGGLTLYNYKDYLSNQKTGHVSLEEGMHKKKRKKKRKWLSFLLLRKV